MAETCPYRCPDNAARRTLPLPINKRPNLFVGGQWARPPPMSSNDRKVIQGLVAWERELCIINPSRLFGITRCLPEKSLSARVDAKSLKIRKGLGEMASDRNVNGVKMGAITL